MIPTNLLHDGLENELVRHVIHALLEGHVDAVAAPAPSPGLVHVAGAGEKVSVLVERGGHYTICQVEGLL